MDRPGKGTSRCSNETSCGRGPQPRGSVLSPSLAAPRGPPATGYGKSALTDLIPHDLTVPDSVALGLFLLAWLGYGPAAQALRPRRSMAIRMFEMRRAWMLSMIGRDNRITDASLIGNVVHSATFFASTTVVALAALLGMLGSLDSTHAAVEGLDFTSKGSRALLEAKVLLLVLIFAYGFLKLSWAVRQLNHCVALIGAAPLRPDATRRDAFADCAADVLSLAVGSFDAGIRAYYFALAALAWLFGPSAFALATAGIVSMLLWRQFGSAASAAIRGSEAALWEGGAAPEPRRIGAVEPGYVPSA
jgi:uncharacterized membrane protein